MFIKKCHQGPDRKFLDADELSVVNHFLLDWKLDGQDFFSDFKSFQ